MPGLANKDEPKTEAMVSLDRPQAMACSPVTERLRVLITDDNKINRKLLRVVLEAENQVVLEADNGISALQLLEQTQVDAIISDILMPEMDGYRLCYEIRKNPKLRTLPFIVYTASYTSPSDEKVALQFGVDKFLRKPASSEEIVKSLHEVLTPAKLRARDDVQIPEEAEAMREYNQVLVRKLEDTIVDLSEANKSLAERSALAEFVATISTTLAEANGLREMLQRCCDAMVEHLSSAFARIWTLNEGENLLELQASSGMYTHIDGGHARVPVGQFKIGLIASERKPHLTNAVIGDPRVHDQEWAKREGMVAFAGYPLLTGDQLVGVMATFGRKAFSQNSLDAMGSVARSIAVGIQRQLSESELRRSEERFRELAENVNEIFFVAAPEGGQVYYVNPAHEQITGQKCAELYQNPHAWLECIHPDDRARVHEALQANSADLDQEYRILRPDGEIRWLRSRAYPIKDAEGKVVRVVGSATDITERKHAEDKVNQNLNRIRVLHDIDLAITSTLDLPTILKALLAKIENVFPYPTVTTVRLLNQTSGELEALACHNIDLDDWKQSFVDERGGRAYQVLKSHAPLIVRNVLSHLDTVNPTLFQKNGLVSYIGLPLIAKDQALGVLNFYTKQEHKFASEEIEFLVTLAGQAAIAIHNAQLHEQTQRNFERIQAILDSALDCIITMDRDGKIVEFNPAAEKTFNYTRAEVIGKELSELIIPPSLREKHRRGLAHYLSTGDGPVLGKRIEITAMRADGSELPAELIVSRSSIDGPATFTGFIRDISERKHAEEQIQRNLERIRALHEIDVAINSTLDLNIVLQVLLEKIDLFITYPSVTTVRLLNKESGQFELLACRNIDADEWKKEFMLGSLGRARRVLETKAPVTVRNLAADPTTYNVSFYRRHGLISYASLPLVVRDEALGVFNLYTKEEHEFTSQEMEFLTTLAVQAAAAIRNAQLYQQTERHLRRIEAVNEIDNAITSTLSLDRVLNVLLEKIEPFCPIAVAAGVRFLDKETGKLVPIAARNIPLEEWREHVAQARGLLSRELAGTKAPIVILNMLTDPRTSLHTFARKYGLVSYLGVPLIVKEEFSGNLVIYTKEQHEFTAEEIEFFTLLARQAAIAIHNARLYEETARRRHEAEELARVARSLTENLDPTVVGERILTSVRELLGVQGSTLRLRQADGSFQRLASSGEVFSQTSGGATVPSGVGLTGRAITEGKPVWSPDILNDAEIGLTEEMRHYQLRSGNRSMIIAPLRSHEKLIGTLALSDRTGRTFADNEVALLQAFADQAALALENAQLYEQTERQLRRIEALREIEKSITSTLDLSTVLNVLMEKLDIFFTYPSAATVRLFDKNTGLLEPVAARNLEVGEWITAMRGVQQNEESYGRVVIEEQAPLVIPNLQTDPRTQNPNFYREHGLVSYVGVPLIAKGEGLGVLGIYTKEERSFSNAEIELLMILAGQVAIAIHNARLYEETHRSRKELETTNRSLDRSLRQLDSLHTALAPIGAVRSIQETIGEIIDRLIEATGADAAAVRICDKHSGDYPIIGQRGYSERFIEELGRANSGGATDWVIKHAEPILAPDIASEDRLRGKRQISLGFRSCAILPLRVHSEVSGVIQISSRTTGYFDEEQKDHLLAVARQMSITLENRELFYSLKASRDELERANRVKDEFLGVMSHELRTPLSVVLGYSRMFQERQLGALTKEQQQAVDVMLRNSQELLEMIESIMDATKIEAGSMTAEMNPISPLELLEEIKAAYDFAIAKNVRLEWQFQESLPLLWSDTRKLRQILTNLINNAIKFTEEGRIVIAVEKILKADEKTATHWLEFRVSDSGVGIPAEECGKIFDRFHQVDSSKTRHFEGVGLGLYIVKSFTEMLGGRVSVCSELGKGSTFTVSLPVVTAP